MDINRRIVTPSKDAVYLNIIDDNGGGAKIIPAEYFSKLPDTIDGWLDVESLQELGYIDPDNINELTTTVPKLKEIIDA